jgi:hypothetical protein
MFSMRSCELFKASTAALIEIEEAFDDSACDRTVFCKS